MSVSGRLSPYNGTVFNLTGRIQLDPGMVNTDITVTWVWSLGGNMLETQTTSSRPHRITITFNPLATNSSGQYNLNLTVIPSENSEYIIGNRDGSTVYDLMVERKF